ncbi:MAG: class I tRNA ligase family protein, partial [Alphaproteobacteria bacterium]|nr:class I tRNA ligase family protein [Alphaproteobacteria bacterium]
AGMKVEQARKEIVKALRERELILESKQVKQNVSVSERSSQPIEFVMAPQWFIRLLEYKDEFLKRSEQLNWFPDHMKVRLDDWVNGLKYDWNISRQRFYGVPFPIWYCKGCGEVVVADEATLPVDPAEQPCPAESCAKCGGTEFEGESDVMETWMTSSLTPLVNANWAGTEGRKGDMSIYPMSLRVQAFEIIRTWLFYTVAKSHFHHDGLPWKDCMISGWGLNEQGKKISKRDLEKFTDAEGFNRYDPHSIMKKYSADALRFWAAGSHLGNDLRFNEKDVRTGRKVVIKMWNVARLCNILLEGFDPNAPRPALADRSVEDRWVQIELAKTIKTVTDGFERYDYAYGREALERFFWGVFCDNYVEIVKDRFWNPERYSEELRASAQATLWESLRTLLALFAPYLPFVTEAVFQRLYKPYEDISSIHIAEWPGEESELEATATPGGMVIILELLNATRELRSQHKISQTKVLEGIRLDLDGADDGTKQMVRDLVGSIQSATRCKEVSYGPAEYATAVQGVKLEILAAE